MHILYSDLFFVFIYIEKFKSNPMYSCNSTFTFSYICCCSDDLLNIQSYNHQVEQFFFLLLIIHFCVFTVQSSFTVYIFSSFVFKTHNMNETTKKIYFICLTNIEMENSLPFLSLNTLSTE